MQLQKQTAFTPYHVNQTDSPFKLFSVSSHTLRFLIFFFLTKNIILFFVFTLFGCYLFEFAVDFVNRIDR